MPFCGMVLTKAAKMGYLAFYEQVAKRDIVESLLFDYGDYLYRTTALVIAASAPNVLGCLTAWKPKGRSS